MPGIVELKLDNPAYGGDTLGRLPDGRVVFVPFSIPGETVRIKITADKKKFARGDLLEVIEPSSMRVDPRCQHFAACGGCHYQHISYDQQLLLKQKILRDQLERIGHLVEPQIEAVIPSPNQFNYRNQIQFHLSRGVKPGFIHADKQGILEIAECHLPEEPLNAIWPRFEVDSTAGISAFGLRLGIEDDILVTLESKQPFDADLNVETLPVSIVNLGPDNLEVLAGSEYTIMQVKDRLFRLSAGSFFQVNTPLAEQIVDAIEDVLPEKVGLALELYSGVGLFSAFIAPRANHLVAIETSESATEDFVHNLDEFENVDLYQGAVEDILPELTLEPEMILVDPPRSGLPKNVIDNILTMQPEILIYLSCDPATLARDSKLLSEGGLVPEKFVPFDLFPQTYHIETLSIWKI